MSQWPLLTPHCYMLPPTFALQGRLLHSRPHLPHLCTAGLPPPLAPPSTAPLHCRAASSTRAPIYRTFALSNNLADVTAKGESVANLADIIGTVMGIGLSKARLPLVPTFCALSVGYLLASRREVDSVQLPYLNRARMAVAMQVGGESRQVGGGKACKDPWRPRQ